VITFNVVQYTGRIYEKKNTTNNSAECQIHSHTITPCLLFLIIQISNDLCRLALTTTANDLWPWITLWLQRCVMVVEGVLVFPVTTRWHTELPHPNIRWQYQSILMLRKHLSCVCVYVCSI